MATTVAMYLWMDEQYDHPAALPASFGDRYLYGVNPVFRGVRDLAVRQGITFQPSHDALGHRYSIAPLFTLPAMISSGTVPYLPNADYLRQVLAESPHLTLLEADLRLVKPNYLLHESAHLIAHHLLENCGIDPAMQALLEESFANALEALGESFATQKTHQSIYAMNAYMAGTGESRLALLRSLRQAFGFRAAFAMALWIFFYLNTHAESATPGPSYLRRAWASALDTDQQPTATDLLLAYGTAAALSLNHEFRKETTPLYFRMVSLQQEFQTVCALDFESDALDPLRLEAAIKRLADAAAGFDTMPAKSASSPRPTNTPDPMVSR